MNVPAPLRAGGPAGWECHPRLLISARDVREALLALAAGADIVDLKEPSAGALGGLALDDIRACVRALAEAAPRHGAVPVSATIGDWPAGSLEPVCEAARAVAECGVRWVKVGIDGRSGAAGVALIRALHAALPRQVVPVLLADDGVDDALVDAACAAAMPALVLDTAGKSGTSLFDLISVAALQRIASRVQAAGLTFGLAGSLGLEHLPLACRCGADIVGFRGAACEGGRTGRLEAARVQALRAALAQAASARAEAQALRVGG
jgi:(5-formylfuran-3-yl)methyl phosphate synthase